MAEVMHGGGGRRRTTSVPYKGPTNIPSNSSKKSESVPYKGPTNIPPNGGGTSTKTASSSGTGSKLSNVPQKTGASSPQSAGTSSGLISNDLWDKINTPFTVSATTSAAQNVLNEQLQKVLSGKTSYSDKVAAMMDQIANREKFSYDPNSDTLFQNALASAMASGRTAMQDTIGQASALTGGYGSSYATSAGNQAYNDYIEGAYDNLPAYYQMALDAYQMEGNDLYNKLGMYTDADNTEYSRNLDAYGAAAQDYSMKYGQDFDLWNANVGNAMSAANLQMSEKNSLFDQAAQLRQEASDNYWKMMNYNLSAAKSAASGSTKSSKTSDTDEDGYDKLTNSEIAAALNVYSSGGDVDAYISNLGKNVNMDSLAAYIDSMGAAPTTSVAKKQWKKKKSGLFGVGTSYVDEQGNSMSLKDLKDTYKQELTISGKYTTAQIEAMVSQFESQLKNQ